MTVCFSLFSICVFSFIYYQQISHHLLTGVCLLMVEIILNTFDDDSLTRNDSSQLLMTDTAFDNKIIDTNTSNNQVPQKVSLNMSNLEVLSTSHDNNTNTTMGKPNQQDSADFKLEKMDAIYFLLTLACSSNIGSALTYTGAVRYNTIINVVTRHNDYFILDFL